MTIDELKNQNTKPAIIANTQGVVIYINASFTEVWGWTESQLLNQPLVKIIPEELRAAHHMGFSRFIVSQKPTIMNQPLALKILKANGAIVVAEHLLFSEQTSEGLLIGATIVEPKS